jgi:hypothetical protein
MTEHSPEDLAARWFDLDDTLGLADRVLELVRTRVPAATPQVRDWNDRLLLEAVGRGYRCLRSIRELAGRREGEDAAVLTRALVAVTFRYLWLAVVDDKTERSDRFRRLLRKGANDQATAGEELLDLGHILEEGGDEFRRSVEDLRRQADEFKQQGVGLLPPDGAIAMTLDRDLQPTQPRFFELLYARIYRPTSDVAHYGLSSAIAGYPASPGDPGELSLERADDQQAAEMLGLALVTFATLLDFSEPVMRAQGLAVEVAEMIRAHHLDTV